jgi:hypothetical protein
MTSKFKTIFVASALLVGGTVAANASTYVATIEQVGSNVVASGSGSIDLTDLTAAIGNFDGSQGAVEANIADVGLGSTPTLTLYSGISGPTSFGPGTGGGATYTSTTSGLGLAINGILHALLVPSGYVSGTVLTSTSTFVGNTLTGLGLTPGTYTWTWGTGDHAGSFEIEIGATPLPAALPLFATGIGGLGLLGWRRKRKAQALA